MQRKKGREHGQTIAGTCPSIMGVGVHMKRAPGRGAERPRAFAFAPGGEIRRCADGQGLRAGDVAICRDRIYAACLDVWC
jgi:hypothetical protein